MRKIHYINRFIFIFFSIVSLGLYYFAPNTPNLFFQILCFLIFLLQSFIIIKQDVRKYGLLNFNLLFLISFFLVTYAFPLFLMSLAIANREGIEAFIDFNVACKCSALCTFAISVYFVSYTKFRNSMFDFSSFVKSDNYPLINLIFLLLSIALFYVTRKHIESEGGVAVESGALSYLYLSALTLALVNNCRKQQVKTLKQFICANFIILIPALIMIILYVIIGDRGLVIISGFTIITIYSIMVKELSPYILFIGLITGSVFMYILRETRSSEASLVSGNTSAFVKEAGSVSSNASALSVFSDLTGIHRELYIGYDYVEHKGFVEPAQLVLVPFYPLPFLPNLFSELFFDKTVKDIKPGFVLNDYMDYSGHGHFGIHCVIDIYMRWGIIGVFVVFYLFGYVVSSISVCRKKNMFSIVLYVTIIASAISFPRKPFLDMLRIYAYIIFLVWLSNLIKRKNIKMPLCK